jgi:hypothetical protein
MASSVYKEMTRLGCEKFVGPMPVDDFLSDFIPEATQIQPVDVWTFPYDTAAHNEDEFVGL